MPDIVTSTSREYFKHPISGHPRLGARLTEDACHFAVWAPKCSSLNVYLVGGGRTVLQRTTDGYFYGRLPSVAPDTNYFYELPNGRLVPDPCSRFQPEGVNGPSCVVDHRFFTGLDDARPAADLKGQVIYEIHVGAFTEQGTFDQAAADLPRLKDDGLTMMEIMPIAEFPGARNWGYDGLFLFAPSRQYGDYNAFKRFVRAAHRQGIAVILDLVYNHFGPGGDLFRVFSDDYVSQKHKNEWGEPVNFDGEQSSFVREFFLQNIEYWVNEFHLDGVRLDATQAILDDSDVHIIRELTQRARDAALPDAVVVIGENEPQDSRLLRPPSDDGFGLDALWCDDFHHSAHVALTGEKAAYYTDYRASPQEFIDLYKFGPLYQGQYYSWQGQNRGADARDIPAMAWVVYLQNHDQVANSLRGERVQEVSSAGMYRTMSALLLLAPQTPMIFMGQEYGETAPFVFFTDHDEQLAPIVDQGRKEFLSQFPSYALSESRRVMAPCNDEGSFIASKLRRGESAAIARLYRDLLRIRRGDAVISAQDRHQVDGAVLQEGAFVVRWDAGAEVRLLVVNLGTDVVYSPASTPLLAPLPGARWEDVFSTEYPVYGGRGKVPFDQKGRWMIPAFSATLLQPGRCLQ